MDQRPIRLERRIRNDKERFPPRPGVSAVRKTFQWRLKTRSLELGPRTLIMGVINVTPDSFSNGGEHFDHRNAIEQALLLIEQGADIIDLGGESTRPGTAVAHTGVPEAEELRRILPVLEGVLTAKSDAIISVDTYKNCVAKSAAEAGAEVVNDVSGGAWDAHMLEVVAQSGCGYVLMHTRGKPQEWKSLPKEKNIVALVTRELRERSDAAVSAGIQRDRIIADPGFGFGKGFDENYAMLARFEKFAALGFPLLAGTSRKGFIGRTLQQADKDGRLQDAPPAERLYGTLATVTAAILQGAHIVRVHDVRAARDAALVADEILLGKSRTK